ncbi:C-X-C chemokine receptor type 3.1 [Eucyclogobius newberryi]|uniref:C-X-C chemokine receptor type 3.1 n=1 Tax=Eucyclogobius newberryi TaxID=166745 RepID=UPI003B58FC14
MDEAGNDTNENNEGLCDLHDRMHFKATFIPVLYSLVFVVGVLGNGALLGVLFRSRRGLGVTDTFILHLCVADFLLLFTLPLWASEAVSGWTFGTPLCKITGAVFTINFYCGILLLACISLDRYLSIVHATQMYSRRNPCVVQSSCFLVWFFSLLLSVPDLMFLDSQYDERRNITECIHDYLVFGPETFKVILMVTSLISHVVGFLLPSAVLIFCYSCILRRLRCGTRGLQKQRASRVIIGVVAVFFLCWTPYNVTLMVQALTSNSNNNQTCYVRSRIERVRIVTSSLGYLHCSLNPILYAFVGVKFRRQLLDVLSSMSCVIKTRIHRSSIASSRKSSMWSESGDTSNSTAI